MSTEIKTNLEEHRVTSFWGGDHRGTMLQIAGDEGYIQLTMEDIAELVPVLAKFAKEEAIRRQGLLSEQVEILLDQRANVFKEICELSPALFDVPMTAVKFVAKYCPKAPTTAKETEVQQ